MKRKSLCGGIYKGRLAPPVHANRSMAMYDQSLVNQYLDTSMALIGANASAIFAANNNNNNSSQQAATVGFIHPLIYQKRVSIINPDDSTAQLLLIPAGRASCGGAGIELTKLAAATNNNPNNPNQVYDDISEAFDVNNKSTAALINNSSSSSKVNEYCYIPANGLVASYMPPPASKPIQIVS